MAGEIRNNLVDLEKQERLCTALGIKFITTPEIVYVARNAGFHALFIDLEHSSLSLQAASHLCVTALNASITPFVRVPGGVGAGFIQRVLDNGAQGVIFPHVDSAGQAQAAVEASKYPPLGKRSVSGMLPHMGFKSTSISRVLEVGNTGMSTVIVMIEGPEAVSNVEAIAAVEGVDVVLIGTNDLSVEIGFPGEFEHPSFTESVEKISAAVKKHKKILGIAGIYDRPDLMSKFVHLYGARFVVGNGDLPLLAKGSAAIMSEMRGIESAQPPN